MHKSQSLTVEEQRKFVSKIFVAVMSGNMSVKNALLNFPKGCTDPTLIASWHALCHFEADEDIRARDAMYAQEQDEYIEYIAEILKNGDALPQNITDSYLPYHTEALIPRSKSFKGIKEVLERFIC